MPLLDGSLMQFLDSFDFVLSSLLWERAALSSTLWLFARFAGPPLLLGRITITLDMPF